MYVSRTFSTILETRSKELKLLGGITGTDNVKNLALKDTLETRETKEIKE